MEILIVYTEIIILIIIVNFSCGCNNWLTKCCGQPNIYLYGIFGILIGGWLAW